jgi:hypothetical protein
MASKGPRKANGGFDLSQSPSHLLRRCVQYANDLFLSGTGCERSDKAAIHGACCGGAKRRDQPNGSRRHHWHRSFHFGGDDPPMIEKGLLDRERTESDQRANAVRMAPGGRKALRSARTASERWNARCSRPVGSRSRNAS